MQRRDRHLTDVGISVHEITELNVGKSGILANLRSFEKPLTFTKYTNILRSIYYHDNGFLLPVAHQASPMRVGKFTRFPTFVNILRLARFL